MAKLPSMQNRTAIIGSTGSGKTVFACWVLGTRDIEHRPWIIFDFKGDALIEKLDAQEIDINKPAPTKAGLYVVRPVPQMDDDAVEAFLWDVWRKGHIGIYIDEGYMIGPRNKAFIALLTQGRSKYIEMIVLSQRPVWMSKFVFSEANFFAVMHLTVKDDQKTVSGYLNDNRIATLPKYHCFWYDVGEQEGVVLSPVPSVDKIIRTINAKIPKKRKKI